MEVVTSGISLWMARIGGAALLGVAILIAVEVVLRSFGIGLNAGTELASYTLALAATWSLAYVVLERGHVRVDIVARKLPRLQRTVLDLLALLSLAIVGAVLTFGALQMVAMSLRLSARSNTTLGIPLAVPQALWTFGLAWFTLIALGRTVQALRATLAQDFATADRIAAAPSADDEVEEAISETEVRLKSPENWPS